MQARRQKFKDQKRYTNFGLSATYSPTEYLPLRVTDESSNADMNWNPVTGEFMFAAQDYHPAVRERFKVYREAMTEEAQAWLATKPKQVEFRRDAAFNAFRKLVEKMEAVEKTDKKWSRGDLLTALETQVDFLRESLHDEQQPEEYVLHYTHSVEVAS